MDAPVVCTRFIPTRFPGTQLLLVLLCAALSGCEGKSLVDDNPVFAEVPPRRSYTNAATVDKTTDSKTESVVRAVSATETTGGEELDGNSVVATVNGTPIFLDDLIGSLRLSVEADSRISPEQRQQIYYAQVRGRLPNYVQQEIVLHALGQAVPDDRQEVIRDTLETPFREVIGNIKKDRGVETDAELNELLSTEGLSVDLLRESFVRIQMVNGYLQTLAPAPAAVDRSELVEYYRDHLEEFTSTERVRWQEIVVLFDKHDGQSGARARMDEAVDALKNGGDFGEIAMKYSDALSAERRGDMGWLEVGGLADKELEKRLFQIKAGELTDVYTRSDRLELYRVADHQMSQTTPFGEVQAQIEQTLKQKAQKAAREDVLADLREKATVVTMFDGESEEDETATKTTPFTSVVPITR